MKLHASLLALLFAHLGCFCAAALALNTSIHPVPILPLRIANDPALANFQTWDIRVTVPPGNNWHVCGVNAVLTQGTFYNHPLGSATPFSGAWSLFPAMRHDTFVTQAAMPDDDASFRSPNILGPYPEAPSDPIFSLTRTSASFGTIQPANSGPGVFTVVRLTFSHDAVGTIDGAMGLGDFGFGFYSFSIPVPEPAGCTSLMLASAAVLLKRRPGHLGRPRAPRAPRAAASHLGVAGKLCGLAICLAAITGTATAARAATAQLVPLPISPAAIAMDPALANHGSWDLQMTILPGERWAWSGLDATLTEGSFYNSPLGSDTPQPALWETLPQLRFDTFVTHPANPADDATFLSPPILGAFPNGTGTAIFTDTRISMIWGMRPGFVFGPGTYTIARLTISDDAVGSVAGYIQTETSQAPFAFSVPVPEPVTMAWLILGGGSLMLRRRR